MRWWSAGGRIPALGSSNADLLSELQRACGLFEMVTFRKVPAHVLEGVLPAPSDVPLFALLGNHAANVLAAEAAEWLAPPQELADAWAAKRSLAVDIGLWIAGVATVAAESYKDDLLATKPPAPSPRTTLRQLAEQARHKAVRSGNGFRCAVCWARSAPGVSPRQWLLEDCSGLGGATCGLAPHSSHHLVLAAPPGDNTPPAGWAGCLRCNLWSAGPLRGLSRPCVQQRAATLEERLSVGRIRRGLAPIARGAVPGRGQLPTALELVG